MSFGGRLISLFCKERWEPPRLVLSPCHDSLLGFCFYFVMILQRLPLDQPKSCQAFKVPSGTIFSADGPKHSQPQWFLIHPRPGATFPLESPHSGSAFSSQGRKEERQETRMLLLCSPKLVLRGDEQKNFQPNKGDLSWQRQELSFEVKCNFLPHGIALQVAWISGRKNCHSWAVYACSGDWGIQKETKLTLDTRRDVTNSGSISEWYLLFVNPVQLTLTWGKYGLQDYSVITTYPRKSCRI